MKNRIEISKNSDGRVEEGKIFFGSRTELAFTNEWDDEGFIRAINFSGQKKNLPTSTELYWLMNEKFIENIRRINTIDEIINIQKIDEVHVANATVQNIVEGFNYTERWETGAFDRKKYFGRTGPFYKTDAKEPPPYTVPTVIDDLNILQPTPWDNAVWMRNSKDGTTLDEVYFGIPQAFNKAVLRLDSLLPTNAQLGVNDAIGFGFEVCSQGGEAIICVLGSNGGYSLTCRHQSPTSGGIAESVVVVPAHTNAFCSYWLYVNLPVVRLMQGWAGVYTILGELVLVEANLGESWLTPFFFNESATILTNFYLGNISVWALEGRALPGHADSAANTVLTAYIETMNARELVLRFSTTAAAFVGKAQVSISSDNVNWDIVEDITLPAFTHYLKGYDDNHYCTLAEHLHNPCIWPFIKVTMDAQGAGKIGTLQWALK